MRGLDWDLNLAPDQQALARRLSFSAADAAEPPVRASCSSQMLPVLPPIAEEGYEGSDEETHVHRSQRKRAATPSVPVTSSAELNSAQGVMPHASQGSKAEAPVHPSQRQRVARQSQRRRAARPSVPVTSSTTLYSEKGGMPHSTSVHVATSPERAAAPSVPVTSSATLYSAQGGMPHSTSAPVATSVPAPLLQSQQLQEAVAAARASEYHRQAYASAAEARARARALLQVWHLRLYTVARGPAGYETKWDELHPVSQRLLLDIE